MADEPTALGAADGHCGLCQGQGLATLKDGAWTSNPISVQMLGVCSALAVTSKLENSLVMGAALTFVCVMSNVLVSLLRKIMPRRIRMIAEVAIIATFVILFSELLKAFYWPMSRQLGPYVGLIITNCIIMGRAEAFFVQNPPKLSLIDALANGFAYAYTLMAIAIFREIFAFGTLLGVKVTPAGWVDWVVLAAPAGAFFVLGVFLWITRTAAGVEPPKSS